MKLQLKRSNVLELGAAKEPTSAQMEYGELAVNYNNGDPALFIKDSADNIIRIAGAGNIGSGDTPSGPVPPSTDNEIGDIFFDTTLDALVYWDGTSWVELSDNENAAKIYVGTLAEIDNDVVASTRRSGFLWWNTEDGTLYVWYEDGNTDQWVVAVPSGGSGGGGAAISSGPFLPNSGEVNELFFNTTDGRLYIYYDDGTSQQWIDASPAGKGGVDGGGGGDTTINYSGAAAWGDVNANGTIDGALNIKSVTRSSVGMYLVEFITPMPSSNYAVTLGADTSYFRVLNKTPTTFKVETFSSTASYGDHDFSFSVFATNALPPKGGTGTDAWVLSDSAGNILNSFNVSSVTAFGSGAYRCFFTTPMPTDQYAVQVTPSVASQDYTAFATTRTTDYFTIQTALTGVGTNCGFAATVHATNATLPATLTQDMIVMKAGDTMTGDLFVNSRVLLRNNTGTTNGIIMEGDTGAGTFTGGLQCPYIAFLGQSGGFAWNWSTDNGGKLTQYVDVTPFNICYSRNNNIVLDWTAQSQVVATIDGVLNVILGTGSDYRLKENVELSTYGTDAVKALRPVSYTLKDSGESAIGFIAHEAAEAVPGAASGEKDGEMMQSINTYPIVTALTKALQESIARIETLEAEVQQLKEVTTNVIT